MVLTVGELLSYKRVQTVQTSTLSPILPVSASVNVTVIKTRMHSSRMRTGRSLTVCWSLLSGGGGVSAPGGGGVSARGVSAPGGVVSQNALR